MSITLRQSVIPPGGFHFLDRSGPAEVRIEGSSPEDVAGNVLKFRLQNNRQPGNPMQELIDYVCGTWPHFCHDTNPPRLYESNPAAEPLGRRSAAMIGAWFAAASSDDGVSQQEAERRASICAACPKNQPCEQGGCGACSDQITRLTFIYRHGRQTPDDRRLKCCDVLSTPLQAVVWANGLPPVTDTQRLELPHECWRT